MKNKWYAILTLIVGILLILPLLGVSGAGDVTGGVFGWIIALAVLIMGIMGLTQGK